MAPLINQLYFSAHNDILGLLVAKIVEHLAVTGEERCCSKFISDFNTPFKLGAIANVPGRLRFYGLDIIQHEDMMSLIDGDNEINAIKAFPSNRIRRKQSKDALSAIERPSFMSVNSSIGWLGIFAYPFCAFYSLFATKLPNANVFPLILQSHALRTLKNLGTVIL